MTRVDVPPSDWRLLGTVRAEALADTRLELHWAVQLVGAVPLAFLDEVPDFSHANLGWIVEHATFVTRRVGSSPQIRVGLSLRDFSLTVHNADGDIVDDFQINGRTLDDGYEWVADMMGRYGVGDVEAEELHRPDKDFPGHPVRDGAPFTGGDAAARAELASWYDNTLLVLAEAVRGNDDASAVRTWPHHFDMATLITLERADDPEKMRSVGVGMTPGDSSYPEPYFYVAPWPRPESSEPLPKLEGGGTWHTEGWVGAVLTGSRLVAGDASASVEAERARGFLASAIPAARALAGG